MKGNRYLECVNWPFDINTRVEGVYLIDDVYIGMSCDIYTRIIGHLYNSLKGTHGNKLLSDYIKNKVKNNNKINVEIISKDRYDERFLVNEYLKNGYALLNVGHTLYRRRMTWSLD
jgi:hypothetical protein